MHTDSQHHGPGVLPVAGDLTSFGREVAGQLKAPGLCELLERPVVGFFRIGREAARRELLHVQMIGQALAAHALPRA